MGPLGHTLISITIGGASYAATNSLPIAAGVIATGVLVDSDHLFDYAYYLMRKKDGKRNFSIREFFASTYMKKTKRTIVPFHSYELLLPLWLLSLAFFSLPLAVWLSVSFAVHLLADQLVYHPHPLAYFLTYRILVGFTKNRLFPELCENIL